VTVKLRYQNFETHTHALTLAAATDRPAILFSAAKRCLDRFPLRRRVRLLGVRVSALERREG
jgi:DNA polymerase-4